MTAPDNCLLCGHVLYQMQCQEPNCRIRGAIQYVASRREGELAQILSAYKFQPARAHSKVLGELLDASLPLLPHNARIVPIPTASTHTRQRGFDHLALLARQLAKSRKLPIDPVLERRHNHRQVGASRVQRFSQAKNAFSCSRQLSKTTPYIIFDDVTTTGATLSSAYDVLKKAGAQNIILVALCQQEFSTDTP